MSAMSSSVRERGVISRLLFSYGFITCSNRKESVFFHFSQFSGQNTKDLEINDEVEFEVGTDSRTGKLIAQRLVRLPRGTESFESVGEERLLGKVDSEACVVSLDTGGKGGKAGYSNGTVDTGLGLIIYENQGKFFFVPYANSDIEDVKTIHKGDEVSFYMATNKRSGAFRARMVRLVQLARVEKVKGIVKSFKGLFGFIQRADTMQDIFFHNIDVDQEHRAKLIKGSCTEFIVQNKQGKEVATQIKVLLDGSVTFDDVRMEQFEGVIQTPVIHSLTHGRGKEFKAKPGEIMYHADQGGRVLLYHESDQEGNYTMLPGDIVLFNIAKDTSSGVTRATHVRLHKMVESQQKGGGREKGMIATLREDFGFGFICCMERDMRMFFHFNEVLDDSPQLAINMEVEFSVQTDHIRERLHAVRIKLLPPNSVQFETVSQYCYQGNVQKEFPIDAPSNKPNVLKLQRGSPHGVIQFNGGERGMATINYYWSNELLQFGDHVEFRIATRSFDKLQYAEELKVQQKAKDIRFKGYVSVLKRGFGFIETEQHNCELFFSFSACNKYCDPRELKLLDEVEYCLVRKNNRLSADEIKKVDKGTIPAEKVLSGCHDGVVVRAMKSSDNADKYEGLIQPNSPIQGRQDFIPYSFISLQNHQNQLQQGDPVRFHVCICHTSGSLRATNISKTGTMLRGTVESIKGQHGFISYITDEGAQSVFFHMNSVSEESRFKDMHPGDEVEMIVSDRQKGQKKMAVYVKKLSSSSRPERLLRYGSMNKSTAKAVLVIRQPRGPDNTSGFRRF